MGDRVTKHMQLAVTGAAMGPILCSLPACYAGNVKVDDMTPPYAPLVMQKQVLQAQGTTLSGLFSRLALLKHRFRRIG
jgi:hypothetical protein